MWLDSHGAPQNTSRPECWVLVNTALLAWIDQNTCGLVNQTDLAMPEGHLWSMTHNRFSYHVSNLPSKGVTMLGRGWAPEQSRLGRCS